MTNIKYLIRRIISKYSFLHYKIIRVFCIKTWRIWEKFGVHISPNHFYWPIPDTSTVLNYDFSQKFPLDGIQISDSNMLALLKRIARYKEEYAKIHIDSNYASNGDGAILYGMLREFKPNKVIEVGSGFSTVIANEALKQNRNECDSENKIISIEPYPRPILLKLSENTDNVKLIEKRVEMVNEVVFSNLESGDILFIDSSHVVKIGNDVHYLYLSILPKVPVGTIIHIHDIRFPYDYPKKWILKSKHFWTEQYLLQMFLTFNDSFEILFAGNYMYDKYPELMTRSLIGLNQDNDGWPRCFWIRRRK